jgi:type VI secretion system protein VasG
MADINLKSLVGKLNPLCSRALEAAAGLCQSRTNYNVEVEHWLIKLLESANSDLIRIFKHYEVDTARLGRDLTRALDRLRTGNARSPSLSLEVLDLMREAWVLASLAFGTNQIRSGFLLTALLTESQLAARARDSSAELAKIAGDRLQKEVRALIEGSVEDQAEKAAAPSTAPGQPRPDSQTPALDQFTQDLTARAREGQIDPVIGRELEIRQLIDVLQRRRQNNPILTGEAGVGKTAVVEGFALRVAAGTVPPSLKGVVVRVLDMGLLQAGAGVKGEFENRLKSVIAEVKASPRPVILFIDEAHTIIGAGGAPGQGDAANLLKPALARGELRTIAATTWNEYKKYFETDAAFKRRFQVIKVEEPDEENAVRMMRGLIPVLEQHHRVPILEEAVQDAVKLSMRYLTDRQLPDKSLSLLDTASSRVFLSQSSLPAALEDCQREIEQLKNERDVLLRESAVGVGHQKRLQELTASQQAAEVRVAELEKRWQEEQKLVAEIQVLRRSLQPDPALGKDDRAAVAPRLSPAEEEKCRARLNELEKKLVPPAGQETLVFPSVDRQVVAQVLSGWTGIPLGNMVLDELQTLRALQQKLEERVVGQSHALAAIAARIQTSRANLLDPRRPIGVFLLVGPSGVGKTETAVVLADILYGGDRNMVVINMSEYKEDHKISRLTGSAPGYVGYGEGGVLTEAVRRRPYSIVLLDEVEKANVAVQEIFYQVFDKGTLQDDKGNQVNFKNTIILLTSNVGTDSIMKLSADPDTRPDAEALAEALRPDLLKVFKPALLGRLQVIPFYPLSDEVLQQIIKLQLRRIGERILTNYQAGFTYDDSLVQTIASRCKEVESGARNVDHILTGTLLPLLAKEFLAHMAEGKPVGGAHVSVDDSGQFAIRIDAATAGT